MFGNEPLETAVEDSIASSIDDRVLDFFTTFQGTGEFKAL